jgi:hypothetical protein
MSSGVNASARGAVKLAQKMFGTSVTLRRTSVAYNSNGDAVKTYTNTTVTAIMEPVAEMLGEGRYGRLVSGEFSLYLPTDVTLLVQGDEVLVGTKRYQVQDILEGQANGSVYSHYVVKLIAGTA